MEQYYAAEWEALGQRRIAAGREEYFRRVLDAPMETFGGEFVKSFGEKMIANVLFCNDVTYQYERSFAWSGQVYRPDFTVLRDGKPIAVIEYFGRAGDLDYDEQSAAKREYWATRGAVLLELTPAAIARGSESCAQWLLSRLTEIRR